MFSRKKAHNAQERICAAFARFCGNSILLLSLGLAGCSIPNLEQPECTEARNVVREFYSFHFGNDMKFSQENLKLREKFLTPVLFEKLSGASADMDLFTNSSDHPKAFRVGECTVSEQGKVTEFEVLLFWKTDERSEQKHVHATARNIDGRWLIDNVAP